MNARQIARVGLGLIGVQLVATALTMFATFARFNDGAGKQFFIAVALPLALLLGFSYVLVFHNAQLAQAITPDADATVDTGGADFARVLFALLGAYLLAEAIPASLNVLAAVMISACDDFAGNPNRMAPLRSLIAVVAKGAIGAYLIARPQRLLELVGRPLPQPAE